MCGGVWGFFVCLGFGGGFLFGFIFIFFFKSRDGKNET